MEEIRKRIEVSEELIANMESQIENVKQNSIDIAIFQQKSAYIDEQLKTARKHIHDVRNKNVELQMRVQELEQKQALIIKSAWTLFTVAQGILGAVTYFFK